MDPAALVHRWWNEAWAGDLAVIGELFAEPVVRHGISGTKTQTHDELKADMRQYLRVHQNPNVVIVDQAVIGDRVWSRVRSEGLNLETGDMSTMCWLQEHRIDEAGRIAEVWTLYSYDADWS
jgi:hypothetical protein